MRCSDTGGGWVLNLYFKTQRFVFCVLSPESLFLFQGIIFAGWFVGFVDYMARIAQRWSNWHALVCQFGFTFPTPFYNTATEKYTKKVVERNSKCDFILIHLISKEPVKVYGHAQFQCSCFFFSNARRKRFLYCFQLPYIFAESSDVLEWL